MDFAGVVENITAKCANCDTRSLDLCQCPCRQVYYCGSSCQKEHWAVHKQKCTAARKGQPTLSTCVNCGITSLNLKSCPCGGALYCSVRCQQAHWGMHRRMCSNWVSTYRRRHVQYRSQCVQTNESSSELILADKARREAIQAQKRQAMEEHQQRQENWFSASTKEHLEVMGENKRKSKKVKGESPSSGQADSEGSVRPVSPDQQEDIASPVVFHPMQPAGDEAAVNPLVPKNDV